MLWGKQKQVDVVKVKDKESDKLLATELLEELKQVIVFDKESFTEQMTGDALIANLLFAQLIELRKVNNNIEALITKR